jgi:hypothetical protein
LEKECLFLAIWNILWRFGIFCEHLVHFSGFGIMYQQKSGNPVGHLCLPNLLELIAG